MASNTETWVAGLARHPNAANLMMAVMLLFGVFGLAQLNTQFFPTIRSDRITVSVAWPGASAEDVEKNVLEVIEPELRFLGSLKEIAAYAREGSGTVLLEFDEGTDMPKALSDVEQAMAAITTLPDEAETPVVSASTFTDQVATLAIRGPFSEEALKVYARKIRDDLLARGIDRIDFNGFRSPEFLVEIPERELRRLDLTVADVAERIAGNTQDIPAGNLDGALERQIRAVAEARSPEALGNIEVRAFETGEKTRLGDIATVSRSFDDSEFQGLSRGQRAIELRVLRLEGTDTLKAAAILTDYLEEVRPTLPPTLELLQYDVRADQVAGRITLLIENGLGGLALVVLILYLFLNGRIALWVAAGIPVAVGAALGLMWMIGESINMISLFALIMMLGVIVDDAIVVGEHTATRLAMGDTPEEAAINGAGTMFWPVIASGTTTIAAFLPILMVGDVLGQIMMSMPIVVTAIIIASLFECFFVLPGHLAHSLRARSGWSWWRVVLIAGLPAAFVIGLADRPDLGVPPVFDPVAEPMRAFLERSGFVLFAGLVIAAAFLFALAFEALLLRLRRRAMAARGVSLQRPSRFRRGFDQGFDWFRDRPFRWTVNLAVNWRYVVVALAIASLILTVGLMRGGRIGFTFFASPEAENIQAQVFFQAGIPESKALEGLVAIEQALYAAERELTRDSGETLIVASYTVLGRAGNNRGDNVASISVQLTLAEERQVRTPDIVQAWRRALPDLAGLARFSISQNRGGPPGRDLDIRLSGAPLASLKQAAAELQDALSAFPGTSGVTDDLPYGKPELRLQLTPRGRALGFTVETAARQIRNAVEGSIARRFAAGDEEVTVRVRQSFDGAGTNALRDLLLRAPSGEFVPLTEVVSLTDVQGFSVIQRRDGRTIVSVVADIDSKITSNTAIIADLEREVMPRLADTYGLSYEFAGKAEEQANAMGDLAIGVVMALTMIYVILAATFASYSKPVVVMTIIPFGVVGAVIGHYVMDYQLTMMSLIGLLGLSGILVNNAIILVARFDELLVEGMSQREAAVLASCDRLRAVILTSFTTIAGLGPLLFEDNIQAQFLLPITITIVFGLGTATLLVLFLVPALLIIGEDIVRVLVHRPHADPRTAHATDGPGRDLSPAE
ncbi:MMPL family transporter [Microvirga tunisiensis]|uniref:MMPL family transporter n=1 Tax=Pannonibacter tanglangensis TaxID=2750084 RepID=A0A7X5F2Z4_9HYPH|nr:efflux RND transporter permease subunit [Pannonibacter sp. XCT-53]NBN78828.1 MMPL family transporter [Pannonibacter sp. XCT-53]